MGTEDSTEKGEATESLVTQYQQSKREMDRTKSRVHSLLIGIATLNAIFVILAVRSFVTTDTPALWAQLGANIAVVAERHYPRALRAAERVAPRYVSAFEKMAERELPNIRRALAEELVSVEKFAEARLPEYRKQLDAVIEARARDFVTHVETAVGRKLTEEEMRGILETYQSEIRRHADEQFHASYAEHREIIEKIQENLDALHVREPELSSNPSGKQATGVLLEFVGVELQTGELSLNDWRWTNR